MTTPRDFFAECIVLREQITKSDPDNPVVAFEMTWIDYIRTPYLRSLERFDFALNHPRTSAHQIRSWATEIGTFLIDLLRDSNDSFDNKPECEKLADAGKYLFRAHVHGSHEATRQLAFLIASYAPSPRSPSSSSLEDLIKCEAFFPKTLESPVAKTVGSALLESIPSTLSWPDHIEIHDWRDARCWSILGHLHRSLRQVHFTSQDLPLHIDDLTAHDHWFRELAAVLVSLKLQNVTVYAPNQFTFCHALRRIERLQSLDSLRIVKTIGYVAPCEPSNPTKGSTQCLANLRVFELIDHAQIKADKDETFETLLSAVNTLDMLTITVVDVPPSLVQILPSFRNLIKLTLFANLEKHDSLLVSAIEKNAWPELIDLGIQTHSPDFLMALGRSPHVHLSSLRVTFCTTLSLLEWIPAFQLFFRQNDRLRNLVLSDRLPKRQDSICEFWFDLFASLPKQLESFDCFINAAYNAVFKCLGCSVYRFSLSSLTVPWSVFRLAPVRRLLAQLPCLQNLVLRHHVSDDHSQERIEYMVNFLQKCETSRGFSQRRPVQVAFPFLLNARDVKDALLPWTRSRPNSFQLSETTQKYTQEDILIMSCHERRAHWTERRLTYAWRSASFLIAWTRSNRLSSILTSSLSLYQSIGKLL